MVSTKSWVQIPSEAFFRLQGCFVMADEVKKDEKDERFGEVEMQVFHELAKVGYTPLVLKQCFDSLQSVVDFLQYIGTNQYYSDSVNKRVFLLTLDADESLISCEELSLREKHFIDDVHISLVLKKPVSVDAAKLDLFKKDVYALEAKAVALAAGVKALIAQIRSEFESRDFSLKH